MNWDNTPPLRAPERMKRDFFTTWGPRRDENGRLPKQNSGAVSKHRTRRRSTAPLSSTQPSRRIQRQMAGLSPLRTPTAQISSYILNNMTNSPSQNPSSSTMFNPLDAPASAGMASPVDFHRWTNPSASSYDQSDFGSTYPSMPLQNQDGSFTMLPKNSNSFPSPNFSTDLLDDGLSSIHHVTFTLTMAVKETGKVTSKEMPIIGQVHNFPRSWIFYDRLFIGDGLEVEMHRYPPAGRIEDDMVDIHLGMRGFSPTGSFTQVKIKNEGLPEIELDLMVVYREQTSMEEGEVGLILGQDYQHKVNRAAQSLQPSESSTGTLISGSLAAPQGYNSFGYDPEPSFVNGQSSMTHPSTPLHHLGDVWSTQNSLPYFSPITSATGAPSQYTEHPSDLSFEIWSNPGSDAPTNTWIGPSGPHNDRDTLG